MPVTAPEVEWIMVSRVRVMAEAGMLIAPETVCRVVRWAMV